MHIAPVRPTLTTLRVRALTIACCLLVACVPSCKVLAIDSEGKAPEQRYTAATVFLRSVNISTGEREFVHVKWLARDGDWLRAETVAGVFWSIQPTSVQKIVMQNKRGVILDAPPSVEVKVHKMHCSDGACSDWKSVRVQLWPAK